MNQCNVCQRKICTCLYENKTYKNSKTINEKLIVDKEFEWIKKLPIWINAQGRPCTTIDGKNIFIHHIVLNKKDNFDVDHIDGNLFNILKSNLRYATRSQNLFNRKKRIDSKQVVKGIQSLPSGKFRAKGENGNHLGVFICPFAAYLKYIEYAKEKYGDNFVLNSKNL